MRRKEQRGGTKSIRGRCEMEEVGDIRRGKGHKSGSRDSREQGVSGGGHLV